jgi:hypothetical protein
MAIAKNPQRSTAARAERDAKAFIAGAGRHGHDETPNKQPIMIRIAPDLLERIDRAAKRLGLSRSAFLVSSAAERLERMD